MQFKKFEFFLFHQKTLLVYYFQTPWQYSKVLISEAPFLRKIGKFNFGLNLELCKLGHFQTARTKKREEIYTSSLQGLVHISQSYFQAIFYLDLGFFFYFLHPCKESNVSSFVNTVNFTIFQKVIASRVYLYIFSGCAENCLLKKHAFFLYVILKAFFWPAKIKSSALAENISSPL